MCRSRNQPHSQCRVAICAQYEIRVRAQRLPGDSRIRRVFGRTHIQDVFVVGGRVSRAVSGVVKRQDRGGYDRADLRKKNGRENHAWKTDFARGFDERGLPGFRQGRIRDLCAVGRSIETHQVSMVGVPLIRRGDENQYRHCETSEGVNCEYDR